MISAAERSAKEILEYAPLGVQASKQVALEGRQLPYREAIARTYGVEEQARGSADFIEGPRAFVEKRKPNWTGR